MIIAATFVALTSLFAAPASASTFGDEGLVLFERHEDPDDRKTDLELYLVDPDEEDGLPVLGPEGPGVMQLTDNDVDRMESGSPSFERGTSLWFDTTGTGSTARGSARPTST